MYRRIYLTITFLTLNWLGSGLSSVFGQTTLSTESATNTTVPLPHTTAEACGNCHKTIYEQWKNSRHAQSAPLLNSLIASIYREIAGDPLKEGVTWNNKYPLCLQCHAPNAAKEQKTKLSEKNYAEGVSCVTCHTIKHFKGNRDNEGHFLYGMESYEISSTHLQGPSGRYLSPQTEAFHPFPMEPNQNTLRSSEICLGCHAQYNSAENVPICRTGEELNEVKTAVTCQSCHMPKSNNSTDHSMFGAHSDTMLTRALIVTIQAQKERDVFRTQVKLRNMLPHNFPTGVPFRNVYIKVTAYDGEDKLLWSNFKEYPPTAKDDPKAVLHYQLANSNGQPLVLPFDAAKVLSDTRLKPYETRELTYEIPANAVELMRVEVMYNLLTAELIRKFSGHLSGDLINPMIVAIAELRLTANNP